MSIATQLTVAAVQPTPVFLDRDATVERLVLCVKEAAAAGARLIVFPEAIVPGYPDFVWRLPAWQDRAWYERLHDQAVDIPGPVTEALGAAAAEAGAWVAVGVTERTRSGTLYNSLLYLSPEGAVAGVHRKLLPTGGERTVWGCGDGSTLTAIDTDFGRIGGLLCWENLMPLARAAMYQQGIDILLAPTWDNSDAWISTLRHVAREGRVFVVGTNTCLHSRDIPRSLPGADELYPLDDDDDWLARGNTAIVAPDGTVLAGPLTGQAGMLITTIDLSELTAARREFDPVGHYARPDVFQLTVHRPHPTSTIVGEDPVGAFLGAIEAAVVHETDAFANTAVLDATVPNWRFSVEGAGAIRAEYAKWFREPATFVQLERTPIRDGELVTYELEWTENGIRHRGHHAHRIVVAQGKIVRDTVWCGGRWPEPLLHDMASASARHPS